VIDIFMDEARLSATNPSLGRVYPLDSVHDFK